MSAPVPKPSGAFGRGQIVFLGLSLGVVGLVSLVQWLRIPDTLALLWQTPLGLKMLLGAGVGLFVGAGIFLVGCSLLNRAFAGRDRSTAFWVVQLGLAVVWLLIFLLPAVFVLLLGPSAIQIQQDLIKG